MKPSSQYRPDIDGLRAVAVMSIVLFHAGFTLFSGGYVGVDVFFVISGYLITRIIKTQTECGIFSFSHFYTRRIRRLFPALLATLVMTYVIAFWLMSPQDFAAFSGSNIYSLLSISNFYFWMGSGYFEADAILKPLLHTWSLSVEE